jgi:hypothetical protein
MFLSNKMELENVMKKLVERQQIHIHELAWMEFQWYENSHYGKVMKWYLWYVLIQNKRGA